MPPGLGLDGISIPPPAPATHAPTSGAAPRPVRLTAQHGIALFRYDHQGTPEPVNTPALRLLETADARASKPVEADQGSEA
ncbi:hypothetical protein ACIRUL_23260 [Streptomyces sp. NPDC101171]|uniref:hypothetical protein n=1 Tax=Streptomyces sp. NPDC101171 TaxID=3366122 RepID=UPI0037FB102F